MLNEFNSNAFTNDTSGSGLLFSPGIDISDFGRLFVSSSSLSSSNLSLSNYMSESGQFVQPTRAIEGEYTCTGVNSYGNRSQTITINVNGNVFAYILEYNLFHIILSSHWSIF